MTARQLFTHKSGALGGGNDIAQGEHTVEEAARRSIELGAKGFTFQGRDPNPEGRVLCYFKSSDAGNADPNWQTYTPHLTHKVGALGGGNDVESGNYTLEEASVRCLSLPNAVGFTFQGRPNQPGKLMCYFKSVGAGNADPNWQTYVKTPGAPVLGRGAGGKHQRHQKMHGHRGGGRPLTPQLPHGVQMLSKNHPTESTECAGAPPRDGLTLEQAISWCQTLPDCHGMWFYDTGRCCPKASWAEGSLTRELPGGSFYQIRPLHGHGRGGKHHNNAQSKQAKQMANQAGAAMAAAHQAQQQAQQAEAAARVRQAQAVAHAAAGGKHYNKAQFKQATRMAKQAGAAMAAAHQAQQQAQQAEAAARAQQAQAVAQQQAAAQQAAAMQVCPQCNGKGGLGTFGPVPRGDMHWKRDCPNCDGQARTVNTVPCPACNAKGGQGTFGPCGVLDMHFKSVCGACQGRGYSSAVPMAGMPMTPRGSGGAMDPMHDQLAREQAARLEAEKKMRQMEYYTKAATLKSQQQYGAAADMYEKAIQEGHPERAECHNMKGECFEELGQLDQALAEFERAVSAKGNDARFLYNRGKVYYKKATVQSRQFGEKVKQFGRAQADLESAINHVGGNHQLREKAQQRLDAIHQELTAMAADAHSRGQQLYASSDWKGAHAAFSEALSTKHGDRAAGLFQRAMCDIQDKHFDAAIKDLNETLQLQPQQPEALYQRACAWRVKRDLQKALVDMNAAAGMGHPAAAQQVAPLQQEIQAEQHFQQARQLFQRDDFQGADQMCSQALATFPAHAGALDLQKQARNAMAADMAIAHGKTLMQQAANPGQEIQYQAAAAALSEAARLLEGTRGLERKLADVHYHLAICDVNGPHSPPPHAQGYLDKALAIDGNALYKELRGKVKYAKGDLTGAKADLKPLGPEKWHGLYREPTIISNMAKAPQGTKVPVEVYLNERYIPLRGWSSGHLLPTDRYMFSHADGSPSSGYEGERHGTPTEKGLQLPMGWQWVGDWTSSVGDPAFDKEGYQYAFNWTSSTYGSSNSMTDCVRRRRLVRVAIKLKSCPGDPVAPAKPAQMPPGAAPVSATAVPAAPVVVAEPAGGAVGPIVVPPAALPPQQKQEAPSPAPVPAANPAAPSAGGTTLIAFLQSVRCEQYTKALVDLGASEIIDLKDMQPEDFESVGMKKLEMNRILAALAKV